MSQNTNASASGELSAKNAKLTLKLRADSGYQADQEARVSAEQWGKICRVIEGTELASAPVAAAPTDLTPRTALPEGYAAGDMNPHAVVFTDEQMIRFAMAEVAAERAASIGAAPAAIKKWQERMPEHVRQIGTAASESAYKDAEIADWRRFGAALAAAPAAQAATDEPGPLNTLLQIAQFMDDNSHQQQTGVDSWEYASEFDYDLGHAACTIRGIVEDLRAALQQRPAPAQAPILTDDMSLAAEQEVMRATGKEIGYRTIKAVWDGAWSRAKRAEAAPAPTSDPIMEHSRSLGTLGLALGRRDAAQAAPASTTELLTALQWILSSTKSLIAGKPVRDLDEVISHCERLLAAPAPTAEPISEISDEHKATVECIDSWARAQGLPTYTEVFSLAHSYNDVIRAICFNYSAGGYNSEGFIRPETADAKIRWILEDVLRNAQAAPVGQAEAAAPAAEPTDEQIIAALHSCGIDTHPSKYGFDAAQVSATSVPSLRAVFQKLRAAHPSAKGGAAEASVTYAHAQSFAADYSEIRADEGVYTLTEHDDWIIHNFLIELFEDAPRAAPAVALPAAGELPELPEFPESLRGALSDYRTARPHDRPSKVAVVTAIQDYAIDYAREYGKACASAARAMPAPTQAALDVLAERRRQIEVEGWRPEHDDEHSAGQLAAAAACYSLHTEPVGNVVDYLRFWPWAASWWKPRDKRRNLVKAGALIVAEIERIDRAALADPQPQQKEGEA